ncbi:MAG: FtsB family cell division protein [Fusobacteriota bacterium]
MNTKQKKLFIILNILIVIFVIHIAFDTLLIYKDLRNNKITIEKKQQNIKKLEERKENLEKNLKNIKKLDIMEEIAREKLYMVKENEKIYRVLKTKKEDSEGREKR